MRALLFLALVLILLLSSCAVVYVGGSIGNVTIQLDKKVDVKAGDLDLDAGLF